jgi:hypothetical protein
LNHCPVVIVALEGGETLHLAAFVSQASLVCFPVE